MQLINVQKLTKYKIEIMYALSYMQLYKVTYRSKGHGANY